MSASRSNQIGILLSALALQVGLLGGVALRAGHATDLTASSSDPTLTFSDTDVSGTEWEMHGNSGVFYLLDAQNGTQPLVVFPSAETQSAILVDTDGGVHLAEDTLVVDKPTGRVGIRTGNPQGDLHIFGSSTLDLFSGMGPNLASGPAFNFGYSGSTFGRSSGFFNVRADPMATPPNPSLRFATANVQRMIIDNEGYLGLGDGAFNPAHPIHVQATGARLTTGGIWTDGSSRGIKQDIEPLAEDDARAALAALTPVRYASRLDPTERHVGFIAEDVPDLVASPDRQSLSPMDIVAVLTRVVQEQQLQMQDQQRLVREQQAALAELRAELAALRQSVGQAR
jgi:hypothetical protein